MRGLRCAWTQWLSNSALPAHFTQPKRSTWKFKILSAELHAPITTYSNRNAVSIYDEAAITSNLRCCVASSLTMNINNCATTAQQNVAGREQHFDATYAHFVICNGCIPIVRTSKNSHACKTVISIPGPVSTAINRRINNTWWHSQFNM